MQIFASNNKNTVSATKLNYRETLRSPLKNIRRIFLVLKLFLLDTIFVSILYQKLSFYSIWMVWKGNWSDPEPLFTKQ